MVRDLKSIAIRERIIIILPVHLRKTDDPSMNDIKGSSGIAQESDEVFMINREKNKDPDAVDFYTSYSKIKLEKNRKTGKAVQGWFTLINGRFVHDQFYKLK
jgi:replicative DNA helicase